MAYSKAKLKSNGSKASPCFLQRCESVTCSTHGRNWFGHNGKCMDTRLTGLFEEYHSTVALFYWVVQAYVQGGGGGGNGSNSNPCMSHEDIWKLDAELHTFLISAQYGLRGQLNATTAFSRGQDSCTN